MKMWDVHLQSTSISDHSDWGNCYLSLQHPHSPAKLPRPRAKLQLPSLLCRSLRCWSIEATSSDLQQKYNDSYRWRFVRSRVHDFETTKTNFGHICFEWHAAVPWKRTNSKQIILLDDIGLNQCSRKFTDVIQSDAKRLLWNG